jgi:hypothetical protein
MIKSPAQAANNPTGVVPVAKARSTLVLRERWLK